MQDFNISSKILPKLMSRHNIASYVDIDSFPLHFRRKTKYNNILKKLYNTLYEIKGNVLCQFSCNNKDSSVRKTGQNKIVVVLKCTVCGKKKSRFFKIRQETNR